MYRGWGVPLRRPWDYNSAQNMFMVSQTFPGLGKRGLRTDIAHSDVAEAKAALDNVRLDVRVRVARPFMICCALRMSFVSTTGMWPSPGRQWRRPGSNTRWAKCLSKTS